MGKIHCRNSLNNIKDNKIIQVTNMLFMPEKNSKKNVKKPSRKMVKRKKKKRPKKMGRILEKRKNNS